MKFLPIEIDETENARFREYPECVAVLDVFTEHYRKVGFNKPWIAYFVSDDTSDIIGGGGFKGEPRDGKIEISYGTFKQHQGHGIGTEICKQLTALALQTDPSLIVTARTLPDNQASMKILERNGFENRGLVWDEEDGYVFEWVFNGFST